MKKVKKPKRSEQARSASRGPKGRSVRHLEGSEDAKRPMQKMSWLVEWFYGVEKNHLEELLKDKIGKDCVSVVKLYLSDGDLEFVKAAVDKNYVPKLQLKCFNSLSDFGYICDLVERIDDNEFLSELQNLKSLDIDINKFESINIFRCIYDVVELNKIRSVNYLFKIFNNENKKILILMLIRFNHNELIEKLLGKETLKSFIERNVIKIRNVYQLAFKSKENHILDEIYHKYQIPLKSHKAYIDVIEGQFIFDYNFLEIYTSHIISKFEWLYANKIFPNYKIFCYIIDKCPYSLTSFQRLKLTQWLLDHNCPYK